MQLWQALFIGALQGVSELFPVSSLAHTILIPALLNWGIDQEANNFLSFVVALHLATAIALVIYFWREWREVVLAYVGSVQRRKLVYDEASKFAWLLVAGTVVVGAFGLVFEKQLRKFFEDPKFSWLVAVFLILNGGVMLYGEYLRKRSGRVGVATLTPLKTKSAVTSGAIVSTETAPGFQTEVTELAMAANGQLRRVEQLSFVEGGVIGGSQLLALFPGISRSGVTMMSGLLARLSHEQAARFSFMLATPVIGLAALLKLPDLFKPEARDMLGTTALAAVLAGITAYLSIRFLMRYFETKRLSPFGYYCMGFGLFALAVLQIRG